MAIGLSYDHIIILMANEQLQDFFTLEQKKEMKESSLRIARTLCQKTIYQTGGNTS